MMMINNSFCAALCGSHRHVVLGVHHNGKFGALGLSRRDDLMFKPLKFKVG